MKNDQSSTTANAYLKTKVLSASPEELRLMLLDGALRYTRIGRDGLLEKDYDKSFDNIIKAKDIVLELINILRPDVDPELCAKLSGLYTYMYRQLSLANTEHKAGVAAEVISLLEYERETWILLMDQIKAERENTSAPAAVATPAPQARLSVEG